MSLKLSRTKAYNPSTKEQGFRTSVKSNGKADMDSLIASASKNTTMHKGEMQLACTLVLDAIKDALVGGNTVELKGIGTIGFSCSGAWTKDGEGDEPSAPDTSGGTSGEQKPPSEVEG